MPESLTDSISLYEREPVQPKFRTDDEYSHVYSAFEEANEALPASRRVPQAFANYIVTLEGSAPRAYRAVIDFMSTLSNYQTRTPTRYTHLLPSGHPLSDPAPRPVVASFFASDPSLKDEELAALTAAAIAAEPNSAARRYYTTRLAVRNASPSVFRMIDDADAAVYVEEI